MKRNAVIFACALLFSVVAQAQWNFSSDKAYKVKHVSSGRYILLHDVYEETNAVDATTLDNEGSLFTITQSGSGYVFTKYGTDKTMGCATGSYAAWNTTNNVATAWTLENAGSDNVYIKSNKGYLGPNDGSTAVGAYIYTDKQKGTGTKWQIVDATDELPNYVGSITSGKYYRLVSNAYKGKTMVVNVNGGIDLSGSPEKDRENYAYYAQLWQITESGGKYQFQNLANGKSIQAWPGQSAQWKTGNTAASFFSGTSASGENTVFWFATVNNTTEHKSLHAAGADNQNNTVVGWQASSEASKWLLWEVEVTDDDLAAAEDWQKALASNVGTEFAKFFTDAACTTLKSEYASMSDDELRAAMSKLPRMMVDEAISVKNDLWGSNATWSSYEKDFRIHEYEPYSNPGAWAGKLGFGDFGRLTQPTGIRLKAGEFAFLYVDRGVANSDGTLCVEMPVATNNTGTQQTLKKGFNKVTADGDCELFITYQNMNTETPLSSHPNIKIHIIGGTCNGAFDLSRGHTDKDWRWLKKNMFKDTYLHIRTNYHLYCCYLDHVSSLTQPVKGMQMGDFIFETIEKTMTTRFNDGYYRPIMTVWDRGGGNPSAGNGRVSWPDINAGVFSEQNFLDPNASDLMTWGMAHEQAHLHQRPLWLAGMREVSNNTLVQIYIHLWGRKTAQGAQSVLDTKFNGGQGWYDIVKQDPYLATKMWYQLWLYFHQKGDDAFFSRWMASVHRRGNMENRWKSYDDPVAAEKDYMRMALAACEAAQTDLYEFFKAWGFFNYAETYDGVNANGVVTISDYENFYVKVPRKSVASEVALMNKWKKEMQSYEKKAPGVMFINSGGKQGYITAEAECAKYDKSLIGKEVWRYGNQADLGCTGYYLDYGKNEAENLSFTQKGKTITITGKGAVGYKIYDAAGELVWISYWSKFTVNDAIAAGIADGTYSLVASLGDDTDLLLSGPETEYTTTGIDQPTSEPARNGANANVWYTLDGRKLGGKPTEKGVYIVNGKKLVVK